MKALMLLPAVAVVSAQVLVSVSCARKPSPVSSSRKIISVSSLWDGMGPPNTDPRFDELACRGTFTISNVDIGFAPGDSPACASPMHQRTVGILRYGEIREIRVTQRPEVLIFRTGTTPPALRVTDWVGAEDFNRVVADLRSAYQAWKLQHTEVK
jgi:hypothetical protein